MDVERCSIPSLWCGGERMPKYKKGDDKKYIRRGTPVECMKIGFGAGLYSERKKNLRGSSLQNIKYIGEVYENNFIKEKIKNIDDLSEYFLNTPVGRIDILLKKVLRKKNGVIDERAFNSVIMFMYRRGVYKVPSCIQIEDY